MSCLEPCRDLADNNVVGKLVLDRVRRVERSPSARTPSLRPAAT